jgi:hypothetical protein
MRDSASFGSLRASMTRVTGLAKLLAELPAATDDVVRLVECYGRANTDERRNALLLLTVAPRPADKLQFRLRIEAVCSYLDACRRRRA